MRVTIMQNKITAKCKGNSMDVYEQYPHVVRVYKGEEKVVISDVERGSRLTLHGVDASLFEDAFFSDITLRSFNELCAKYISKLETVYTTKERADHE